MGLVFRLILAGVGLFILSTVLYLLVKRKLSERNSFLWIFGAFLALFFTTFPNCVNLISEKVGVDYPPSLGFFFAIIVIFFIVLDQSIQISRLQQKNKELTQIMAIMQSETRANCQQGSA